MKIISEGTDPAKETYEASCRRCGTVFEFEGYEAKNVVVRRKPGDDPMLTMAGGYFWEIGCPLCKNEIRVNQHHTLAKKTENKLREL